MVPHGGRVCNITLCTAVCHIEIRIKIHQQRHALNTSNYYLVLINQLSQCSEARLRNHGTCSA